MRKLFKKFVGFCLIVTVILFIASIYYGIWHDFDKLTLRYLGTTFVSGCVLFIAYGSMEDSKQFD